MKKNLMDEAIEALEDSLLISEFLGEITFYMEGRQGEEFLLRVTFEEVTVLRGKETIASVKFYEGTSTADLISGNITIGKVECQPQGGAEGSITAWNSAVDCRFYIRIGHDSFSSDEALVFKDGTVHVLSSDDVYSGMGDRLVYSELMED